MPLERCQAVADTREIIKNKLDSHHKLHNKEKRTKIWIIVFFVNFLTLKA